MLHCIAPKSFAGQSLRLASMTDAGTSSLGHYRSLEFVVNNNHVDVCRLILLHSPHARQHINSLGISLDQIFIELFEEDLPNYAQHRF
jgi:hypothetical protein